MNIVFPVNTKERIERLGLDKTNSAFIRDTVLAKPDELEKILIKHTADKKKGLEYQKKVLKARLQSLGGPTEDLDF